MDSTARFNYNFLIKGTATVDKRIQHVLIIHHSKLLKYFGQGVPSHGWVAKAELTKTESNEDGGPESAGGWE